MRILVTGASGLLGTEAARLGSRTNHQIFSVYHTHPPASGKPLQFDLTRLDAIGRMISDARPDIIIHTAALTDVDFCEEHPKLASLANGTATGKIGEAARELGAYVVYVSTDYVFSGQTGSYREEDTPNPVNEYGRSKLLGEDMLKASGSRYCVARTSVVFGWGREHRPNFAMWVLSQLESTKPLRVARDQFASPTLNTNLAQMILELANKRLQGIIHLAGATRTNRYNFARQIAETFHHNPSLIESVKSDKTMWKAKRPTDSSLNVEKATRLLESKPLRLGEALEQFRAIHM
jgi:dTDP-4-dehydrorhamnose reductase